MPFKNSSSCFYSAAEQLQNHVQILYCSSLCGGGGPLGGNPLGQHVMWTGDTYPAPRFPFHQKNTNYNSNSSEPRDFCLKFWESCLSPCAEQKHLPQLSPFFICLCVYFIHIIYTVLRQLSLLFTFFFLFHLRINCRGKSLPCSPVNISINIKLAEH